jgi:hypothetical protein
MSDDGGEWFGGTDGRSEDEGRFLEALRAVAAGVNWEITPDETFAMPLGVPLYLSVDVPAMATFPGTRAARQLELTLWPRDSHQGLRLDGFWGNSDTPLDDVWVLEGGKLLVVGVEAPVEDLAQWAVPWIKRQLERRLRLRLWKAGGASATTEDTGEHVGLKAGPWRRVGAPSSEAALPAGRAHSFFMST